MKSTLLILLLCGSYQLSAETALNEVDFTNSPATYAGKEYTVAISFNPFESSVSRMHTQSNKHYGGLLVDSIDGDKWGSTQLYFKKADVAMIKKVNEMLKGQNVMEPTIFRMRIKYLGKFGDFMGGTHGFELVEILE